MPQLLNKIFFEHDSAFYPEEMSDIQPLVRGFRNNLSAPCFFIDQNRVLSTSYFIGADWLNDHSDHFICVEPKLNKNGTQTDYLAMLSGALKNPEIVEYTEDLYEIKFNAPYIELEHQNDLITPLIIGQLLSLSRRIVRKGLKKSYYKVSNELNARVKGKILISETIKQNLVKNKQLATRCRYDEFGVNNIENKVIKKALLFAQQYLKTLPKNNSLKEFEQHFSFIMPAFEMVSDKVTINEIKQVKYNAFYKEYKEAIHLAKLLIRRFGYNITNAQTRTKVKTPPFWIDMSKLFELYVLGLLKKQFKQRNELLYHFTSHGNELDYLLNSGDCQMVIDAKYKDIYKTGYNRDDIRQISGYARLEAVYRQLNKHPREPIECLIIYPDMEKGSHEIQTPLKNNLQNIDGYIGIYKIGVKLPVIHDHSNESMKSCSISL